MHSDMRIVLAFTVPAVAALLGLLWVLNNKRRPKGGKSDPAVKDAKLSSKSKDISTVSEPVESSLLKKNTVSKAFKESPQESSEIVSHDATCYEGGKNSCLGMMNLQHVHNRHLDSQDILSSINVTVTPTNSIVKLTNSGTCLPLQIIELSETGCSSKNEVKLSESHELSGKSVEEPSFSVGSSFSFSEDVTGPLKSNTPAIAVEKTKSGDAEASALKQESSMESWNVAQSPSSVTDLMITNEVDVSEMNKGYPSDIAVDSDISLCHQQMEATSEVMCFGPLDLGEEKKEDVGEVDSVVQSFPTSPHLYNIESDFSENTCSVGHIAPSSIETPKQSIDALDSNASCDTNTNIETMENTQEKLGPSLLLTCKKCDTSLGIEDERTSISETFQDLSHGCTSKDVEKCDCGMGLCQTGVKELMATTNSSDPSVSRFSFMFRNTALSHDAEITQTDISNSQQDQASIEGTDCSRTCCDFTCTSTNDVVISGDDVSRTDTSTGHISVITTTESPATESIGNYFPMGENSCKREVNDTDTIVNANFSVYNEDVTVADHLLLSQKQFVSNKSSSPLESKEREEIVSATPPEDITAQITGHSEWQQDFLFSCTVDSLVSNESASATENNLGAGCKNDDFTLLETKVLPPDPFHFTENSSFTCLENIVSENDLPLSEIQASSSLKEAPEAMLNDIFGTQLHTSSSYVAEGSDSDCTTELPLNDELLHRRECANNGPVLSIFKEASSVPAKTVSSHIISLEPGDVNSSENNLDAFNQLSSLSREEPYSDDLLNIYQDRPFMDVETNLEETVLDTSKQLVADICETESKQTVTDVAEQADAYVCETKFEQTVADTGEQAVCDSCEAGLEQTVTDEQVVTDVCVAELEQDVRDIQRQIVTNVCEAKLVQIIADTPKQVVTDVCETNFEDIVKDVAEQDNASVCATAFEQTEIDTCEQTVSDTHEACLEQTGTVEQVVTDICEMKLKFVSDSSEQTVPFVCKADLGCSLTDMPEQEVTDTFDNQEKQEATDICESYSEQTAINKTDEQSVVDKQDEQAAVDFCKSGLKQSVTYKQDENVVMGVPESKKPLLSKQNDHDVFSVYESNFLQSEKLNEKTGVGIAESRMSIMLREDEQTVKSCEIKQSATDISDGQTVLEPDTIQLALKNHQQDKGFQQSLTDTQDKWVVFAVSESVGQHHTTDEKDEHTALTIDMSFKFHEPNCPFPTSPDKMNSLINPLADGNSSSSVGVQESKQQTVTEIVSEHASVVDGPSSLQSLLTNSSWLSNDHSHPEGDDSQDQGNSSWLMVESEIKMDVEADLLSVKTRSKDNLSSGLSQHKMANNQRKSQKKKAAGARNPKPSDPHTEYKITGGISSPVSKRKKAKSSTKLEKSLKNSSESLKSNVYSSSSSPGSDLKDRVHKASLMLENSLQPFSGFDRNNQHLEKDDSENESQSPKDSMQTECSVQLCNGNKQTDHCFQEVQEELSEQDWIGVQISNGSEHMELTATNMASSSSLVAASLVTVEFNFPTDLCGRLIGRNGRNVQHIKEQSGASVIITSNPVSPDFQLCRVQGLHSCVHEALMMIKKKFPQVDVQPILAPNLNPLIMPDMIKLNLPDGVSVKLVVSNIVNAGHIFVQLPNHPTFASLDRLCHCMNSCYTKNQGVPPLPRPVETGVICAAESGGCWFRVEIIGVYPETDECDLAYVDYGGYDRVALSSLRQIRSDFMTLPFQAIECYMANITPLQDEEYFSENASSVLHELTAGKLLDGQVITREGSIPYIHLYQISTRGALLVNREMVNREVVRWIEIF